MQDLEHWDSYTSCLNAQARAAAVSWWCASFRTTLSTVRKSGGGLECSLSAHAALLRISGVQETIKRESKYRQS